MIVRESLSRGVIFLDHAEPADLDVLSLPTEHQRLVDLVDRCYQLLITVYQQMQRVMQHTAFT